MGTQVRRNFRPDVVTHTFHPTLRGQRQVDLLSSEPARVCSETLSQKGISKVKNSG